MKVIIKLFYLIVFTFNLSCFSNDNLNTIMKQISSINKEKNVSKILEYQNSIIKSESNDESIDMLKQLSSTYKSLIGEYKSASETYQNRDAYETLFFDNSSQINAISYIQEKSKNTTIVMVNESHHLPKHRVLTTKILKNLSANGYKYLAVEALQNNDEERINIDGSVSYKSGIYMQEPVFNRLIKEAKKYGFQIISYDNMSKNRDAVSAKNIIKKTFDLDKNAKVLIHVGYDHINEKKNLAFHLKDLLDINPLTIDQTYLENTQIKVGLKSFPIAFIDQQKNAWSAKPSEYDLTIYWPKVPNINGREYWLNINTNTIKSNPDWCNNIFPCFIEVYNSDDSESDITPIDKFLWHEKSNFFNIIIGEGSSYIQAYDSKTGKLIKTSII